ncbi:lytic murein transglycosylase [Rhodovulum sulfidophilum]|uniref:lytic murein transglycosylase n=1 Tax=Rhodovulum sulfidophilum TaxID=35806 RepID=UPI000953412F|nr:murein transglycosylase [Rhodovulum sulfidophilum]
MTRYRSLAPGLGVALGVALGLGGPADAMLERVPRPLPRPDTLEMRQSPRPEIRSAVVAALARAGTPDTVADEARGFPGWIAGFRGRALAQGIAPGVFDRAFEDARFQADVIRRDRNQSEFVTPIWDYLDNAVSEARVRNGRAALAQYGAVLERIEARYGVYKEIVAAIWGMETSYGSYRGSAPIISSLATLAYEGRRAAFFEAQLVAALKIIQSGDTDARHMTGSWAGAMGHTQFMPTSYLEHAVDFTGDGRRDIWSEDPTDALASTAAYLAHFGWTRGQPWGVEVQLPRGFDHRLADRSVKRMPSDWARLGVRDMTGRAVRDYGRAAILQPAGARGAAFMIFDNFRVIERYNPADAYVIGVGHLADRLKGGGPIRGSWPRDDRALASAERKELQERLTRAGFDTGGVDGRIGPNTVSALRAYQSAVGMIPDGYASMAVLRRLR